MARKDQKLRYPRLPEQDWSAVDKRLNLPSDDDLRRFAEQVNAQHEHKPSTRVFAQGYRLIGLHCERQFARVMQIPMPLRLTPHGTRRVGFRLANGWSVDVVGRTIPAGMIYPDLTMLADSRFKVDALVLVAYAGEGYEPEVVGWLPEETMRRDGAPSEFRSGVKNLVIHWRRLESISTLAAVHDPRHPLAGKDERPLLWLEGTQHVSAAAPKASDEGPAQASLFDMSARQAGRG